MSILFISRVINISIYNAFAFNGPINYELLKQVGYVAVAAIVTSSGH